MTSKTTLQPELIHLLQLAYSAERAASFAYQGHVAVTKEKDIKLKINEIEKDEWLHRKEVLLIMNEYKISISKWYEIKYYIIGKIISLSCYIIGTFIANYFAGRLESGNVNEYYRMKNLFNEINIYQHDALLIEMGNKEKEHELFFLELIKKNKLLPFFEKTFSWGKNKSFNDINL